MTDISGADHHLRWPRSFFRQELKSLIDSDGHRAGGRVELFLEEAFAGPGPLDDFRRDGTSVLFELRDRAAELVEAPLRRPRWSERRGQPSPAPLSAESVVREVVRLLNELDDRGYFEYAFEKDCVDDPRDVEPSAVLEVELGIADLWPLDVQRLTADTDLFYDLLEVLHDLVARPRDRSFHSYGGCGWHYKDFSRSSGQTIYRWRINRLLDASEIRLRLASSGEDVGRLMVVDGGGLDDAVEEAIEAAPPEHADEVLHAIALFRSRGRDTVSMRSAIVTLAGVMERHRKVLGKRIPTKDEAALFEIANKYDLRHRKPDQHGDYDPAFLEWIFHWYLATVALLGRLAAAEAPPVVPPTVIPAASSTPGSTSSRYTHEEPF